LPNPFIQTGVLDRHGDHPTAIVPDEDVNEMTPRRKSDHQRNTGIKLS